MELVFVYGTLKRGHHNNLLLRNSTFIGGGITNDKYIMYESGIPFVSKAFSETNIIGEVYTVNAPSLYMLDMLEGHPTWYKREKVPVTCLERSTGKEVKLDAWLYFNEEIPQDAKINKIGIYGHTDKDQGIFKSLLYE